MSLSQSHTEEESMAMGQEIRSKLSVSIIIPTYNESKNITNVVTRCLASLPASKFDMEILIVDDDSPDRTWEHAFNEFRDDPRVSVIRRQTNNSGLAESVTDGFRTATSDYCAVIDADLQHPPEKLPKLFRALDEGADVAIGSRHIEGGGIENWPASRKIISKGATYCAKTALPDARSISDPMSGFFAVRRDVVDGVELDPRGYKILLEVLAKAEYDEIEEIPYVFKERKRGESNLTAGEYLNFLEHMGGLSIVSRGLDDAVDPWQAVRAAEFGFIGATGAVVNMIVFTLMSVLAEQHFMLAGATAFIIAVNWNFLGNWLLTYDRPQDDIKGQYARFHIVSISGFIVYSIILGAGVIAGLPELMANAIAILSGATVNFLGTDNAVFPTSEQSGGTIEPTTPTNNANTQTN